MVSADRRIVVAIALFTALLALFPLLLSEESFVWVFSEAGPFERLSEPAWIVTALIVIFRIRPLGPRAWAFALLCLAFAAREADWHKAFTGESFLKNSFYRDAARPIEDKLICGAIALALIGLLLYAVFIIGRFLFLRGGWRSRSGAWLLAGTLLVVAGKVLDRLPATLSVDYGIELGSLVKLYAAAFEEGMEMIHPMILGWSVWISQFEQRYLS